MAADQELKESWAAAMAAPRGAHLGDDVWERLFSGEEQGSSRAEAFEHVSQCAQCAATYRELSQLRSAARAFDPGAPPALGTAARGPRWAWMGIAAAALLATLVGLSGRQAVAPPAPTPLATDGLWSGQAHVPVLQAPRAAPPALQPSAPDDLRSAASGAPVPQAPRGALTRAPASFRWDPVPDLSFYRVELLSNTGQVLWSSADVEESLVAWPPALRLASGRYYWHVIGKPTRTSASADEVASPLVQIDLAASSSN